MLIELWLVCNTPEEERRAAGFLLLRPWNLLQLQNRNINFDSVMIQFSEVLKKGRMFHLKHCVVIAINSPKTFFKTRAEFNDNLNPPVDFQEDRKKDSLKWQGLAEGYSESRL